MSADEIAAKVINEVKSVAKDAWESWSDAEKELVVLCARDSVAVLVRAAAGEDVSSERKQINAQLANIKVAAMGTASSILWKAVVSVVLKAVAL